MIFKLETKEAIEYITAKNFLHLIAEYFEQKHESESLSIIKIEHIDDETAKNIILPCDDGKEIHNIPLYNLACGDDFMIIGGTEYYPH